MEINYVSDQDYHVSGLMIHNIQAQRFCVFDVEATGLNHETEHIIQIGAVIIEHQQIQQAKVFKTNIKSPKPIPAAIERFTGIYNADIEDAPPLQVIYDDFVAFTKDSILVTHAGYEFDLPLLHQECYRNRLQMLDLPCLDIKALFSYLHPEITDILFMDYLIQYYNVADSNIRRHDALGNSMLTGRILLKMLDEMTARNMKHVQFVQPVTVKRYQLKPLL